MTAAPTLVATSINPFNRLPEQIHAFNQWGRLGAEIITFNSETEVEHLLKAGVPSSAIRITPLEDTAMQERGKPIPRIAPILESLDNASQNHTYILVNSDIYPAAQSHEVFRGFLGVAPAVALTREETPVLEEYDIDSLSPYRGGLDAFVFSKASLQKANAALKDLPCSRTMFFGVPGWDFLLGAVIESASIGGAVMDSGLLLHQSHATTYANIEDFRQFSSSVAALVDLENEDYLKVAEAYAQRIEASCQRLGHQTNMIRSMHFSQAWLGAKIDPAARRLAYMLHERLPSLEGAYRHSSLVGLIDMQRAAPRPVFYSLYSFFLRSKVKERRFFEILAAIACGLGCMKKQAPSNPLPAAHKHEKALANIDQATSGDLMQRRLELAYLLGIEVIDHAVFNADLFAEIVRSCANDDERDAIGLIDVFLKRLDHAA